MSATSVADSSRTYDAGAIIFRQGDDANGEAYLIHEGTVEVRRSEDSEERVLRTLGQGDLLGEVSLFRSVSTPRPRWPSSR